MDHKDITIFLELVRCRNISKTAENLYLSQSAVSSRLKALEEENAKLKKLLAEQMLDMAAMKELLSKKW